MTGTDTDMLALSWSGGKDSALALWALRTARGMRPRALGEFHTFVHAGPIFDASLACETGEVVERDGFVFCDVRATEPAGRGHLAMQVEDGTSPVAGTLESRGT